MIAIGAARSSGHGVATTSTATARTGSPLTTHAAPATRSVSGTKSDGEPVGHPHERRRRRLGLLDEADDAGIRRLAPPPPSRPARPGPRVDHTAADIVAGGRSTGSDSPVSADSSSTAADTRRPSTGMTSPVPTSSRRRTTSSTGTSTTPSSSRRRAVRGARSTSRLELPSRPRRCPGFQQLPAREHHRDHRARERLVDPRAPARASTAMTSTLGWRRERGHRPDDGGHEPEHGAGDPQRVAAVSADSVQAAAPTMSNAVDVAKKAGSRRSRIAVSRPSGLRHPNPFKLRRYPDALSIRARSRSQRRRSRPRTLLAGVPVVSVSAPSPTDELADYADDRCRPIPTSTVGPTSDLTATCGSMNVPKSTGVRRIGEANDIRAV